MFLGGAEGGTKRGEWREARRMERRAAKGNRGAGAVRDVWPENGCRIGGSGGVQVVTFSAIQWDAKDEQHVVPRREKSCRGLAGASVEDALGHGAFELVSGPAGVAEPVTRREQFSHRAIHSERLLQALLRGHGAIDGDLDGVSDLLVVGLGRVGRR